MQAYLLFCLSVVSILFRSLGSIVGVGLIGSLGDKWKYTVLAGFAAHWGRVLWLRFGLFDDLRLHVPMLFTCLSAEVASVDTLLSFTAVVRQQHHKLRHISLRPLCACPVSLSLFTCTACDIGIVTVILLS